MAIPKITVEELAAAVARADERVALVDVREPDEWADGHVRDARLVPLGSIPDHLDAFGTDGATDPTYVICKSGGRSLHACEFAAAHGKNVVNVIGGMMAWTAAGHDVTVGN